MKKGEKKKQQKAFKRRAQSQQQRRTIRAANVLSPRSYVRQARNYPIMGCWIRKDWQEHGLAVIVVARRQPNGNIVFGNYLVDYYCLGLKDTYCNADIAPDEFHDYYLPHMFQDAGFIEIFPALAHEIIYGAMDYAAQYGFKPQRDFRDSQYVLDPPDAHPRSGAVEFSKDGKPFFINGPYDGVDQVIRQLMHTAGEGNFEYLAMMGPPDAFDDDLDIDDDLEDAAWDESR